MVYSVYDKWEYLLYCLFLCMLIMQFILYLCPSFIYYCLFSYGSYSAINLLLLPLQIAQVVFALTPHTHVKEGRWKSRWRGHGERKWSIQHLANWWGEGDHNHFLDLLLIHGYTVCFVVSLTVHLKSHIDSANPVCCIVHECDRMNSICLSKYHLAISVSTCLIGL